MDIIINNLFQEIENLMIMNTFLSNVKPGEYKIHPTSNMIKESFRNIGDGDILGFHESYFNKSIRKKSTMFQVSNKPEYYWNNLIFVLKKN
jgi:hypothetical protein